MYADRVTAESGSNKRSIKDRLHDSAASSRGTSRQSNAINANTNANKRQRQNDNKWKHDLYEEDEQPQLSNPKVGVRDLRQKLQKRGLGQLHQTVKGSNGKGPQDLRQKLSGTMHAQPANIDLPDSKEVVEVTMPARKSIPVEVPTPEIKKPTITASRKKSQQKAEASVDSLLQSLGLEKYSITFQAEEIDMTALMHMNDDDLRALGVPMGPRKKILLALDSRA